MVKASVGQSNRCRLLVRTTTAAAKSEREKRVEGQSFDGLMLIYQKQQVHLQFRLIVLNLRS
jgi:hypothetical protein